MPNRTKKRQGASQEEEKFELVDSNNTLLMYCASSIAVKQKLCIRSYAALLECEQRCQLYRITEDGSIDIPIQAPLPASSARESAVENDILSLFGEPPFAIRFLQTIMPNEQTREATGGNVLSLFIASLKNAALRRKNQEDARYLLLTPIEQVGLLTNQGIHLSPLLRFLLSQSLLPFAARRAETSLR